LARFVFGIEEMDEYYKGALAPRRLIVLKGQPGSGKTLLASTICVSNALELGHKCLYVSFQEDEEKFIEYSEGIGLKTTEAMERGLVRFVRLPLVSSEEGINEVLDEISRVVSEYRPRVVVIDSISPILQVVGFEPRARGLLQNYFYNLPSIIEGIVVLIAEIPLNGDVFAGSGIDFVADMLIYLKSEVKENLLVRKMEIKKIRGHSIYIGDAPFKITRQGIQIFLPPLIERVPPPGPATLSLDVSLGHLGKYVSRIRLGESVYLKSSGGDEAIYLTITYMAHANKARTLLVSFRRSEEEIKEMIYERIGVERGASLCREITVHSINPAEKSFEESLGEILYMAKRLRPKLLVIDGIDVPMILSGSPSEVLLHVRNLQLIARTLNSVILVVDYSDKPHEALLKLSDVVILSNVRGDEACISAARKGRPYETKCLSVDAIEEYRESLARRLREAVKSSMRASG